MISSSRSRPARPRSRGARARRSRARGSGPRGIALLAALCLTAAACSSGPPGIIAAETSDAGGSTSSPADAGPDATSPGADDPASSPAASPDGPTIRDADLASVPWRESVHEMVLTPATHEGLRTIVVAPQVEYTDVDGDGHEDAFAALEITDGQGFEQIWYIWLWDPEAEEPVQVENPIARMARCGDSIHEISSAEGAFVVTESLRLQDGLEQDCASDGPVQVTRQVTVVDGWPVLTGGMQGHGGICPQRDGTDAQFPVEDYVLQDAPAEGGAALTDPPPLTFGEVDVWGTPWLFRPHWMLVHVGFDNPVGGPEVIEGGYTPCAWVHLEDDTRPIPHDVHTS
ncbi:hypothetical protein [Brachybacterium phenoliresistens]|uniref:hypothetical protein n=1 Tax=Brachybacterium phenoliresistens TaxID=396014 RepID=UPI0031D27484